MKNSLPGWVFWWTIFALLTGLLLMASAEPPPVPKAVPTALKLLYFSATASNTNGMSEFSNEVVVTNSPYNRLWTLECDPVVGDVSHYTFWQGRATRMYTNSVQTTNTTATIAIAPPPKTNRIVIVTTTRATNIQYCPQLSGPWYLAGKTNITMTNPPVGLFYRPMGKNASTKARAFITIRTE